jgi:hypothetical protein
MNNWTKILPLIFIEWLAKRNLSKIKVNGEDGVRPYKNVFITFEK